uniref:Uncharacterized protein n=1 Tax=Anguilla anguilla TaxID=7936 RepID=A0A0E9XUJ9_ANGAN
MTAYSSGLQRKKTRLAKER